MKTALLSNINVNPISMALNRMENIEVYASEGYGNELVALLNKNSSLHIFCPDMVFIFIDIMELIRHNMEISNAETIINEWFSEMESALLGKITFYISDAYLYGFETDVVWDRRKINVIENLWNEKLYNLSNIYHNIRIFNYSNTIKKLGENNAFSSKMWYMGKILYSGALQKVLLENIIHQINIEIRQPRKVLLLDLDNTLWKGLAGESDITPIVLSEEGAGLAYKNFQRGIKELKEQGVILGIVSKNNEADAMRIIDNHPHMVLKREDFAVYRINWNNKAENILSISEELNVGADSIVFVDDNEAERALVKEALNSVCVPDFPNKPEELTRFIADIYRKYFEKPTVTAEDRNKTKQYMENVERKKLEKSSVDFEGYLKNLKMKLYKVDTVKNKARFLQLVNKTNQFNLTTKRFTEQELYEILNNQNIEAFLYKVVDKFGDNGIIAAVIVEYGKEAVITEFTMSCRVMGRKIEDAILWRIEKHTKERGYSELVGLYKPTAKNKPVENLYPSLGYEKRKNYEDNTIEFVISLSNDTERKIYVEMED